MTAGPDDRLGWHEDEVEVVTSSSGRTRMQDWLNRDLFVPALEPEDDDEGEDDA